MLYRMRNLCFKLWKVCSWLKEDVLQDEEGEVQDEEGVMLMRVCWRLRKVCCRMRCSWCDVFMSVCCTGGLIPLNDPPAYKGSYLVRQSTDCLKILTDGQF